MLISLQYIMAKDNFIKTGDVLTRIIANGPNFNVLKYIVTSHNCNIFGKMNCGLYLLDGGGSAPFAKEETLNIPSFDENGVEQRSIFCWDIFLKGEKNPFTEKVKLEMESKWIRNCNQSSRYKYNQNSKYKCKPFLSA